MANPLQVSHGNASDFLVFLLFLLFAVGCSALHLPNALWNTFNEAKFRSLAGVGLLLLNLSIGLCICASWRSSSPQGCGADVGCQ